jgi:pyruvate dehydrogenase E2 component (dihydrolipoamide acetyltransferase)
MCHNILCEEAMATKITMPKLSDTMKEGVLVKWHKKEGDVIASGDVIAEAESDKATMELEAFDSGILKKILVPEGGRVAVNAPLAIIAEKDEDISKLLKEIQQEQVRPIAEVFKQEAVPIPITAAPVSDQTPAAEILTSNNVRIKASPLARNVAREKGLDLRKITGSGTGGRIVKRDIEAIPVRLQPVEVFQPAAGREIPLSTMREAIATAMTASKSTVPHFYLTLEINMDKAVEFRTALNQAQTEIKVSYNDMILKAVAIALTRHPRVNGSFAGNKIILNDRVDIGVAVALEDGLITPVVRNCEKKSLGQIAREAKELAERAKGRKLKPDEYTNGTFNLSNLGMYEIEEFSAIITPPQAAVLAVGAILQKPVVRDGQIAVGSRMKVTLSCDHRIIDGSTGAMFLQELKKILERPEVLAL